MWEYLIGYGPAPSDAAWFVEERSWSDRAAMIESLAREGWELHQQQPHRQAMQRLIFRRPSSIAEELPRHRIPCW